MKFTTIPAAAVFFMLGAVNSHAAGTGLATGLGQFAGNSNAGTVVHVANKKMKKRTHRHGPAKQQYGANVGGTEDTCNQSYPSGTCGNLEDFEARCDEAKAGLSTQPGGGVDCDMTE